MGEVIFKDEYYTTQIRVEGELIFLGKYFYIQNAKTWAKRAADNLPKFYCEPSYFAKWLRLKY